MQPTSIFGGGCKQALHNVGHLNVLIDVPCRRTDWHRQVAIISVCAEAALRSLPFRSLHRETIDVIPELQYLR